MTDLSCPPGLHPHPGQRVERVQALRRVQGATQPPEDAVSAGGRLQLPAQESHRKQGGSQRPSEPILVQIPAVNSDLQNWLSQDCVS